MLYRDPMTRDPLCNFDLDANCGKELHFMNRASRSPLQREALAPWVFHLHRDAAASTVFYLEIHSAIYARISWVLVHNECAVERTPATKVVYRRCCNSASMLFHPLVLTFLLSEPDHPEKELTYS